MLVGAHCAVMESNGCLICGGPITEYGACKRTLEALGEPSDD